jgi:hypothetical protein
MAKEVGFLWWRAGMLSEAATYALELGRLDDASQWAREALVLSNQLGDRQRCIRALAKLSAVAAARDRFEAAGRLWGAIEAEEARGPTGAWQHARREYEQRVLSRRTPALEQGLAQGHTQSLDEAIQEALSGV